MTRLLILLFLSATEERETFHNQLKKTDFLSQRYLYHRFHAGTTWQVYLPVMTYDLLYSSIYTDRSSNRNTQRTLLDVTSNLPRVTADRQPCGNSSYVISAVRWERQLYFQFSDFSNHFLLNDSRICGFHRITYIPGFDKGMIKPPYPAITGPLIIRLIIESFGLFYSNITLELTAPNSYGCADVRLELQPPFQNQFLLYSSALGYVEMLCPNSGSLSIINTEFTGDLVLNYRREKAVRHNRDEQYFTIISFHRQILYYSFRIFPLEALPASLQQVYNLTMHSNIDATLNSYYSPVKFVGELPNTLVYIFVLHIIDYLTPVVFRENVTCNNHATEVIFYDGRSSAWLISGQFQPILVIWNCTGLSDGETRNHHNEEVRGSLGAVSILVLAPKKQTNFHLEINWQAKPMLPSVFRQHTIELGLSTNNTTNIRLTPAHGNAYEVVQIVAPATKFVHLSFSDIKYIRSTGLITESFGCDDGIEIQDPLQMSMDIYRKLGVICSNSTAENILKRYTKNGLTFGRRVNISLIQYWWMAHISAIITARSDHCAGYINLLPYDGSFRTKNLFPSGTVYFYLYVSTWAESDEFLDIYFRRATKSCARFQVVIFNSYIPNLEFLRCLLQLQYTISSEDLTSPSHYRVDLTCIGDDVQFINTSTQYRLRLVSASAFTQVESFTPGVYDVEAYVAEIRMDFSFMTHAAGLVVQVEDGKSPPTCSTEHREAVNMVSMLSIGNVYLSGPCSHAELQARDRLIIIIYRPYDRHCCRLEGTIVHTPSTKWGLLLLTHLYKYEHPMEVAQAWTDFGNRTNIIFNVLCDHVLCMGIKFYINQDSDYLTHETTLFYRASSY